MTGLAELTGYLAAADEWGRLADAWGETMTPGDPVPAAVKQAEAKADALKQAAGYGGPGDPLCCQRYSFVHRPSFSVPGCRWYSLKPHRTGHLAS